MRFHPAVRRKLVRIAAAGLALALTAAPGASGQTSDAGENWPRFRGATSGAIADDAALPETWNRTENVAWNVEVPGQGWSSPIVWGDLVFVTSVLSDEPRQVPGQDLIPEPGQEGAPVTSVDGIATAPPLATPYTWMLHAIEFETGRTRWQRELRTGIPANQKHPKNTYATETPVTDGEFVYVFHAGAGLFAVDFNGDIAWSREVSVPEPPGGVETATRLSPGRTLDADYFVGIGQAASPALHDGRIFIAADHEALSWFFAAYSTQTGEELWHVIEDKTEEAYGWSSPFVWENDLRTEVSRPQFSWTRIRGESDVTRRWGDGWFEASEGSRGGAAGGSPEGERSRRRRGGGWVGGLGAWPAVEREPEAGRGAAAAAWRVAGCGLA